MTKRILITGGKGMLGTALLNELSKYDYRVVVTDVDTMDITKPTEVCKMFNQFKPEVVFHLAAYTNVDKAELDTEAAYKLNVLGTANVVDCCKEYDSHLIYVSTDYVFGGDKTKKYTPKDEPCPLNVYGETKLAGEIHAKTTPKCSIARTSWLYGPNGKNFINTMIDLMKEVKQIRVVDDQIGYPTYTLDLAKALVKLIDMPCKTYHICGGHRPTSWYELALTISTFMAENCKASVIPIHTKEYGQKARRPKFSAMKTDLEMPDWEDSLAEYMESIGELI